MDRPESASLRARSARGSPIGAADVAQGAWLRAACRAATDVMAVSDPDGRVLEANPVYHPPHGHTRDEVPGQSFAVIFPRRIEPMPRHSTGR